MRWGKSPDGYEKLNLTEVPMPNVAATVYVCIRCGVMVGNTADHDNFHRSYPMFSLRHELDRNKVVADGNMETGT